MELYNVKTEHDYITKLGESPYWEEETNSLIYVDMLGKKLISYKPDNKELSAWDMKEVIGCANPVSKEKSLIAIADGIYLYDMKKESYKLLWKRNDYSKPSVRFNDGKCDAKGRFWVGTTDVERNPVSGLYKFTGELEEKVTNLVVSNGIVWTNDGSIMYHIDTWTKKIFRYDYDMETGSISNQQEAFAFADWVEKPDGMTIDTEGMLWIALFGNGCVGRFHPETGELLAKVMVPVKYPTTCVFGGKDKNILYIPSAVGDDDSTMAGKLFSVELPYQGYVANRFDIKSIEQK